MANPSVICRPATIMAPVVLGSRMDIRRYTDGWNRKQKYPLPREDIPRNGRQSIQRAETSSGRWNTPPREGNLMGSAFDAYETKDNSHHRIHGRSDSRSSGGHYLGADCALDV